ncbi:hypothetical protein [Mucisphaera sp.]|uniref:SH3 domain-containing protein n=1 Tax=Mucisphaera sp. TaxID=2913024 RepID=UPI003D142282
MHQPIKTFALWITALLVTAGLTSMVQAQAAEEVDLPFIGVVVPENAELRAGPGKAYYTVGASERGDFVEVHEALLGWYKISAPEGVFSYISKAFVRVEGDGSTGVVIDERAPVRAASLRGTGWSYKSQTTLDPGDEVSIVAEEGSFYKILPPDSARVFVARDAVRLASPGERAAAELDPITPAQETAEEPVQVAAEDSQPLIIAEPEPTPVIEQQAAPARRPLIPVPAETTAQTVNAEPARGQTTAADAAEPVEAEATRAATVVEPEPNTDISTQATADTEGAVWPAIGKDAVTRVPTEPEAVTLAAVEAELRPKFSLPLTEMPIEEMIATYTSLRENEDLSAQDQQIVEIRLIALERNRQLRAELEAEAAEIPVIAEPEPAPVVVPETAETSSPTAAIPSEPTATTLNPAQIEDYAFVGVLLQSSLYNGEQGRPSLLRLMDPTTRRTLGYLVTRTVSDRRAISALVGIVGEVQRDADLGINIITPEQIDILSARP